MLGISHREMTEGGLCSLRAHSPVVVVVGGDIQTVLQCGGFSNKDAQRV